MSPFFLGVANIADDIVNWTDDVVPGVEIVPGMIANVLP